MLATAKAEAELGRAVAKEGANQVPVPAVVVSAAEKVKDVAVDKVPETAAMVCILPVLRAIPLDCFLSR